MSKIRLTSLYIFLISVPLLALAEDASKPHNIDVLKVGRKLDGRELLIEAVDVHGQSGIYTLDTSQLNNLPIILEEGAANPLWSPNHKKVFFIRNKKSYIYQVDGYRFLFQEGRIGGSFSSNEHTSSENIFWDLNGKINCIRFLPAFGERLDRGVGIRENIVLDEPLDNIAGFIDTIIPLGVKGEPLAVHSMSVTSHEKSIAVQAYPSGPAGLKVGQSKIIIYDTLYGLGTKDEKKWQSEVAKNRTAFLVTSTLPQLNASTKFILTAPSGYLYTDPQFSPSGKYLAVNRVSLSNGEMRPIVIENGGRGASTVVNVQPAYVNEHKAVPDLVSGWPSHRLLKWSSNDQIWIISGQGDKVYLATGLNGKWVTKPIIGLKSNLGIISQNAIWGNKIACVYVSRPSRLFIYDSDKPGVEFSMNFPPGMDVKSINW